MPIDLVGFLSAGKLTKKATGATPLTIKDHGIEAYLGQFQRFDLAANHKNGFVHCGTHPIYTEMFGPEVGLQMIGPDMDGHPIDWEFLASILPLTTAEETGSKGAHLYYLVPVADLETGKWKNITSMCQEQHIKEIDVRGINGKSFCAGSDFRRDPACSYHVQSYKVVWAMSPTMLDHAQWMQIKQTLTTLTSHPVSTVTLTELPMSLLDITKITDILARCAVFTNDPDDTTPHTRHDEFLHLAELFCKWHIAEANATAIITSIAELVQTKPDSKSPTQIVKEVYAIKYHIKLAEEQALRKALTEPNWTKLLQYLGRLDASFNKRNQKAAIVHDRIIDGENTIDSWGDQIIVEFPMVFCETINDLRMFNGIGYTGTQWDVRKTLRTFMVENGIGHNLIDPLLSYIKDMTHQPKEAFDTDAMRLVCKNGVWNESTRSFSPTGDPEYLNLWQASFTYLPDQHTYSPAWNEFMQKAYPDDVANQKRHCLMMRGLLLAHWHTVKRFVILFGPHDTGKSITYKVILQAIGAKAYAEIPINKLDINFKTGSQHGKRLIATSDGSRSEVDSDAFARLKKMTGNDTIGFERKGKEELFELCEADYVLACNQLPTFNPREKPKDLQERGMLFVMNKTYPQNPVLEAGIKAENDAIISYLLNMPEAMDEITKMPPGYAEDIVTFWNHMSDPIATWWKDHVEFDKSTLEAYAAGDTAVTQPLVALVNEMKQDPNVAGLACNDIKKYSIVRDLIAQTGGICVRKTGKNKSDYWAYVGIKIKVVEAMKPVADEPDTRDAAIDDMLTTLRSGVYE